LVKRWLKVDIGFLKYPLMRIKMQEDTRIKNSESVLLKYPLNDMQESSECAFIKPSLSEIFEKCELDCIKLPAK
jgi:hypothetical protein